MLKHLSVKFKKNIIKHYKLTYCVWNFWLNCYYPSAVLTHTTYINEIPYLFDEVVN